MGLAEVFQLMASYNQWMNKKIYDLATVLSEEELKENRGAFFQSIHGTLNHIMVGDIIWLQRFAKHSGFEKMLAPVEKRQVPKELNALLYGSIDTLHNERQTLDKLVLDWAAKLTDEKLNETMHYEDRKGNVFSLDLWVCVLHFFNHQTHHRGQLTTLLAQMNLDIGVTDLHYMAQEKINQTV